MLRTFKHLTNILCRPAIEALWPGYRLPWKYRWRLLLFQPIHLLTNLIIHVPLIFRRPYTVDYIPIAPGRDLRVLVYKQPSSSSPPSASGDNGAAASSRLRPLHIDCHGGGFVGGTPEINAPFCTLVARETGAVVISLSYRLAPVHPFPAAPDDVDTAVAYLRANAASRYGADPSLTTTSGSSAGGTLMLAAAQQPADPPSYAFKAMCGFYPPVDVSTSPSDKPLPKEMEKDPLRFMAPLYDSYAAGNDPKRDDPRLSPTLAKSDSLPPRIVIVIPKIDILVKEQLEFIERLNQEAEANGLKTKRVESLFVEDGFHGYLDGESSLFLLFSRGFSC